MTEIERRMPLNARFHLTGPVELYAGDRPLNLGGKRERRLLTALLRDPGRQVSRARLVDWIWDAPPSNENEALYEVVSHLRRYLRVAGLGDALSVANGGYRLDVPPESVDVHLFALLVERAEECGDEQRLAVFDQALGLWRGEPLAGLDGVEVEGYRTELSRHQLAVEVQARRIDVRNGRNRKALPRLERAFREQPGDTTITGLYLYALHATGQRSHLTAVYDKHEASLDGDYVDGRLKSLYTSIRRGVSDLNSQAEFFLGGVPRSAPQNSEEDIEEQLDSSVGSTRIPDVERSWNAQNVNYIHSQLTTGTVVFGTNIGR